MKSSEHKTHTRVSHSNCSECRADTERRFVDTNRWSYDHMADFLAYVKPRLAAIRQGNIEPNARNWYREFVSALHRRINLKTAYPVPRRKYCHSYLERLNMSLSRRGATERYLRDFARRGASCLDWGIR